MINEEVTIKIKGVEYPVKFPNVGEFYRIEAMKQSLSMGYYNVMLSSASNQAQHALDMIDIQATLVILCPKLIEDLKVKNFSELHIKDYVVIRDAYLKTIAPFFKEIEDLLRGKNEDDVKGE